MKRPFANAPLFLRLFVWILAGAVAMQLGSVALVLLLPAPEPNIYSIDQIAGVLRGSPDPGKSLTVTVTRAPPRLIPAPEMDPIAPLVAKRLGVAADRVEFGFRRNRMTPLPMAVFPRMPLQRPEFESEDPRRHFLFGDFVISLHLPDQTWRNVEPTRSASTYFWRRSAIAWILAALLAITPIAWLLAQRIARPIAMFAKAAERLGYDPRGAPLAIEGPPEIAEAAAAFNEMQRRLSRFVHDRATLMAAIAHDLRTPLMRLALRLEAAPEPLREAAEADIHDMRDMLASVMQFLRDISHPFNRVRLDLFALAASVVDGFIDQGQDVLLLPGETVVISADRHAVRALVANLVQNAINYGGGSAEIEIGRTPGTAWIEVRDRGPGIPPDQLEALFEPFTRLEQSRCRETGGMGLGLASVRAVAQGHGGAAILLPRPGGGTIARVTLALPATDSNGHLLETALA